MSIIGVFRKTASCFLITETRTTKCGALAKRDWVKNGAYLVLNGGLAELIPENCPLRLWDPHACVCWRFTQMPRKCVVHFLWMVMVTEEKDLIVESISGMFVNNPLFHGRAAINGQCKMMDSAFLRLMMMWSGRIFGSVCVTWWCDSSFLQPSNQCTLLWLLSSDVCNESTGFVDAKWMPTLFCYSAPLVCEDMMVAFLSRHEKEMRVAKLLSPPDFCMSLWRSKPVHFFGLLFWFDGNGITKKQTAAQPSQKEVTPEKRYVIFARGIGIYCFGVADGNDWQSSERKESWNLWRGNKNDFFSSLRLLILPWKANGGTLWWWCALAFHYLVMKEIQAEKWWTTPFPWISDQCCGAFARVCYCPGHPPKYAEFLYYVLKHRWNQKLPERCFANDAKKKSAANGTVSLDLPYSGDNHRAVFMKDVAWCTAFCCCCFAFLIHAKKRSGSSLWWRKHIAFGPILLHPLEKQEMVNPQHNTLLRDPYLERSSVSWSACCVICLFAQWTREPCSEIGSRAFYDGDEKKHTQKPEVCALRWKEEKFRAFRSSFLNASIHVWTCLRVFSIRCSFRQKRLMDMEIWILRSLSMIQDGLRLIPNRLAQPFLDWLM